MERIVKQLAEKYNLPIRQMDRICNSPFKFAKKIIEAKEDRDILFHYLFKFKRKQIIKTAKSQENN